MAVGTTPRAAAPPRIAAPPVAAALLALIVAAAAPAAPETAPGASSAYDPKPRRLEILQSWEKRGPAPPEIACGIYERDYERGLFENKLAITIDDAGPNKDLAETLDILKKRDVKAVFFIIGSRFLWPRRGPCYRQP